MFEDATFHSSGALPSQTSKWMLLAFAVNLTLLSAAILLPLIYPEGLPSRLLPSFLSVPAPILPTQQQSHSAQPARTDAPALRNPFLAPLAPPVITSTEPVGPPPVPGAAALPDSGPGVGPGSGTSQLFHSAPPAVHPSQPTKVIISSGVTEGLLIYKTTPAYPVIAKTAGISGTVTLAATISKSGTIENLHVLAGHPMLRQAAIDAVQHWLYRPYLLNNQPVEVETTINVVFSMGNR
jgi:protein TonB